MSTIVATRVDLATGRACGVLHATRAEVLMLQPLRAGLGLALDVAAQAETEAVAGLETDTPYAVARPTLDLDRSAILADGVDAATVTVEAGCTVVVREGGAELATIAGPAIEVLLAVSPTTLDLAPSWPWRPARVVAT